jgi:hypothetical protein
MNNLPRLAELLRARNTVESNIANLIKQPVNIGSVGDYIASVIFGITYEKSPAQKAIYGRFLSPLDLKNNRQGDDAMIIRTIRESVAEQFTCQNCWIIQR